MRRGAGGALHPGNGALMRPFTRYWHSAKLYLVRDQRMRARRVRNWYYPHGGVTMPTFAREV